MIQRKMVNIMLILTFCLIMTQIYGKECSIKKCKVCVNETIEECQEC